MIPREISVLHPPYQTGKPKGAVVMLCGRGNTNAFINDFMIDLGLDSTILISMRPLNYAWYPQPISSIDQTEAVRGLKPARYGINQALDQYLKMWDIPREETVIMGFSAGGVMAIEVGMFSETPFKAVVCCGGAILDTNRIPQCKHDTPIILQHNKDDFCFDWFERYLPMRNSLKQKGYKVLALERAWGNHHISKRDAIPIGQFLAKQFNYSENWVHPATVPAR